MEISNKTLALVLVLSLVVSLTGTWISLTRLQTQPEFTARAGSDTGNVTLTISSVASLIFRVNTINFGSGSVNTTAPTTASNCILDTLGYISPYNCSGFTAVTQPLVIENDGNLNLSVTINSSANASQFIGGTLGGGPAFLWNFSNNETNDCQTTMHRDNGTFVPVNVTTGTTICADLNWVDTNDTIRLDIRVRIPVDSLTGQRNATITATGTQS